jgi:ABC-type transporter Mla subunit MlaD
VEDARTVRKVGALTILFVLGVITFVLVREGRQLGPGLTVWVEMANAGPLTAGSKVRVAGLTIGAVRDVGFSSRHGVTLRLWIARQHAWMVRERSEFFVNQPGLLSEPYMEVGLPEAIDPGPPLADGARVRGVDPSSLDRLLVRSWEVIKALDEVLEKDFPELGQLGDELSRLEVELDALPLELPRPGYARAADELAATTTWLAGLWPDLQQAPAVLARGKAALARGQASVARVRSGVDRLSARLAELRGQLPAARLARIDAAIARVDALVASLDGVLRRADELVALIERGEGSLAAFAQDAEIADDVKDLTKLLKSQPWRLGHPDMGKRPAGF